MCSPSITVRKRLGSKFSHVFTESMMPPAAVKHGKTGESYIQLEKPVLLGSMLLCLCLLEIAEPFWCSGMIAFLPLEEMGGSPAVHCNFYCYHQLVGFGSLVIHGHSVMLLLIDVDQLRKYQKKWLNEGARVSIPFNFGFRDFAAGVGMVAFIMNGFCSQASNDE